MESINQDLQASYSVIKLLEGSNINSERVFKSLPGVFAILNNNDEILRGNQAIASHLNVDHEEILRKPFSRLFTEESWNVFATQLKQIRSDSNESAKVDFELGIESPDMISGEKSHYWHLRKMNVVSKTEGSLIIVIGEDISELRESERKLNEIFSSIPLGIFTVASNGKIEDFQSSYLEHLLGESDFTGKTIREVLFDPSIDRMTDEEKEGVVSLDFVLGQGAVTYDMLEPFFPKQIFYPHSNLKDGGRWLKVIYQPVIYDDQIKRLLIILEDRTEIIKTREMKKKAQLMEDLSVQRVMQLKQVDKKGLHLYMKELNNLVKRLRDETQTDTPQKQLFASVHSIKGIARVAGFTYLKEAARRLESEFQKAPEGELRIEEDKFLGFFNEFYDLMALYRAIYPDAPNDSDLPAISHSSIEDNSQIGTLFTKYNDLLKQSYSLNKALQIDQLLWGLMSYHYVFANTLEEGLITQANATALSLGKKVIIDFDWGNVLVKTPVLSGLNECLIHLINNAIDHGIEAPEKRVDLNKTSHGNISIVVSEKDSILTCDITDDGAGIDANKIRELAAKKGIQSSIELAEMDDDDVLQLVLHPGFTTSETVSDTSGRGIGMEAVMSNLERFRGAIHIDSKNGKGTAFQLTFRLIGRDDLKFVKKCYPLVYFKKVIKEYLEALIKENQFEIEMNFDPGFEKGIFYGDLVKVMVCFASYIGQYACRGKIRLDWSLSKEFYVKCTCTVIEKAASWKNLIQFEAPNPLCTYFIKQDNGSLMTDEDGLSIEIPCYFHAKGSPHLVVGYTQKVDQAQAKSTFKKIKDVAADLDVNVSISGDKQKINMLIYPTIAKDRSKLLLPYPGFTALSSTKKIQQDMLTGIEQLMELKKRKIR